MRLMGACGPLIAAGMILTQALFGAGNPRFVMFVELLLHFGVLLPLAYLLGVILQGGLLGVWSSAAVYVALLTADHGGEVQERQLEEHQHMSHSPHRIRRAHGPHGRVRDRRDVSAASPSSRRGAWT